MRGPAQSVQRLHLVPPAALLLALLTLYLPSTDSVLCEHYSPTDCLFSSRDDSPAHFPVPLHPSSFSLQECPFQGAGMFTRREDKCSDPFMAISKRALPQVDSPEHCASGSLDGEFKRQGERFSYKPHTDHKCSYFDFTRNEVLTSTVQIAMKLLNAAPGCLHGIVMYK